MSGRVCESTDLVELSVGTENEGQDMKHFDSYHTASLIPFTERKSEIRERDR